jgi:prenylcysteine oxidase/farnesylcysteine lyase
MVSMAPQGAKSVVGGNWRIFASMARFATRDLRLNTNVTEIIREKDGSYKIKYKSTKHDSSKTAVEAFDEVIIASPYQFTDLSISPELDYTPETIPYVKLHVALIVTPLSLNPGRFNLPPDAQVPLVVLTTLPPADQDRDGSKPTYAGKPGFFSVSLLRPITNPKTGEEEYLYKIFSPEPFTHGDLASILNVPEGRELTDDPDDLISWIYRKEWHSYPVEWPRVTFEKSLLAPGLWYTGGMDSFISTMETNALMGKNVAKLVTNQWRSALSDEEKPRASGGDAFSGILPDNQQKVLKSANDALSRGTLDSQDRPLKAKL